jgi:hypothetical protein
VFFTNHLLAGALIGSAVPTPLAAFILGVGSHVAMDVVPHWGQPDYNRFLRVARVDGLAGLAVGAATLAAAPPQRRIALLAGMVGAGLLDLDKPCQHLLGFSPFPAPVDRFHSRIQRGRELPSRWPRELAAAAFAAATLTALRTPRAWAADGGRDWAEPAWAHRPSSES